MGRKNKVGDLIEAVLEGFNLTENDNFYEALRAVIGSVTTEEFSDFQIISMVIDILKDLGGIE
jgi:hypothetical protein